MRIHKYKNKGASGVDIPEKTGDKRSFKIPMIVDRIIIVQVLSPIYKEQFSKTSYGFRLDCLCEIAIFNKLIQPIDNKLKK